MSCVYKHTFPNGAVYIGKTNMSPEDRWLNGWGYKNCPLMFNAILQFGWNNVQHEILADNLTEKQALDMESAQIRLHSASSTMIYNIAQLPAQYLAQENSHFIDGSAQYIPQTPPSTREHRKQHIIPITPKPEGMHSCPIDVYTTDGTFICTYPSAKIAAEELNVSRGDITSCCKGFRPDGQARYQVKGYIFRYNPIEKEVG